MTRKHFLKKLYKPLSPPPDMKDETIAHNLASFPLTRFAFASTRQVVKKETFFLGKPCRIRRIRKSLHGLEKSTTEVKGGVLHNKGEGR